MDRLRQDRCMAIRFNNRKRAAQEADAKKQEKNAKIYADMKAEAEAVEGERQANHFKMKTEYAQKRREEKAKKRKLNIEIASELIDLIMDVVETANEHMETAHQDRLENDDSDDEKEKISKATWREWMKVFSEGKRVSEINMVIESESPEASVMGTPPPMDSLSQILNGSEGMHPYQLITNLKNEPMYRELLQYIAMTGPLNFRHVATDKWNIFKELASKATQGTSSGSINTASQETINDLEALRTLDLPTIPKNNELGAYINRLYAGPFGATHQTQSANDGAQQFTIQQSTLQTNRTLDQNLRTAENIATNMSLNVPQSQLSQQRHSSISIKPEYPNHHPVKLCLLGSNFSGKKSLAKSIKEKYGENITLFDMNEIIREALNYVDPSQKNNEPVDPKAKGKPKDEPVDIFAGKDTKKYVQIAEAMLKQVQITTGAEGVPAASVDLVDLINDEEGLCNLFGQKLILTFASDGSNPTERDDKRKEKISKEKELLEQLEEAKQSESIDAGDPKAKGKKGGKSVAEIEAELKELMRLEVSGWVLLDFPRTTEQAKAMEKVFTGYEAPIDKEKPAFIQNYEVWSKLTDPENAVPDYFTGDIMACPSLFDAVFLLDIEKNEVMRRADNRKIDPNTNTVYHMEDSPPPDDAKLVERLVDHFDGHETKEQMLSKAEDGFNKFQKYQKDIGKFFSEFGQFNDEAKTGIEALQKLKMGSKDQMAETASQVIESILSFKQIEEDKDYAEFKARVTTLEASEQALEQVKSDGVTQEEPSKLDDHASKMEKSVKQSRLEVSQISGNQSKMSLSHSGLAGTSRTRKKVEYTVQHMLQLWEEMESNYVTDGIKALQEIQKQRSSITQNLNNCQRQFIEFLERPSESQEKVNEFVNSFNHFSMEYPDLRSDEQTKEELLNRLERLSNNLWDITNARKEEALEKVNDMQQHGWNLVEMKHVIKNMATLIEVEIKKLSAVYQICMKSEPPVELDAEIATKKLLERGVSPYDSKQGTSPALEQVLANLMSKAYELVYKNPNVTQVFAEEQGQVLKNEFAIFLYRLSMVHTWALVNLQEIHTNATKVYNKLDDWIVASVQQECAISQHVTDFIKDAIQTEKLRIEEFESQLQPIELFSKLEVMVFRSDETPLYLNNVVKPSEEYVEVNRFSVEALRMLYKECRYNAGELGHLSEMESSSFLNLLVKAVRQGKTPLVWQYSDMEKLASIVNKFQQAPVKSPREDQMNLLAQANKVKFVDWKQAMLSFALFDANTPTVDEMNDLKQALKGEFVNKEDFLKVPFWFERAVGKPDRDLKAKWVEQLRLESADDEYDDELDEETINHQLRDKVDTNRVQAIKNLLFDLFRVPTGEDKMKVESLVAAFERIYGNGKKFSQYLFEYL